MLGDYAFGALPISAIFDNGTFVVSTQNNYAKIPAGSVLFSADQQFACTVDTWDTPFTPLESDVPSAGLVLGVQQPDGNTKWSTYLANLKAASATNLSTTFGATSATCVSGGRVPNVFESWGAGAPAWFGAEHAGQIALHYHGQLRPVTGRSWFNSSASVQMSFALAGSGYVRMTKTVSGVTTDVNIGGTVGYQLSEQDFLENGLQFTDVLTLAAGDSIDIYYVQNGDVFGGLVAKAVNGSTQTQALAQAAPVLGAGLFDDGAPPSKFSLPNVGKVQVQYDEGGAFTAEIECPLIDPQLHDGFGFEYQQDQLDHDDEYLNVWDGGTSQYQLRKGRLIRISLGEPTNPYVVFTGVLKDFARADNGVVTLQCLSFEHRLLETHTKNEPDELSYMCFGYQKQSATGEPVYGVPAYDNWAMEYCIADLMYHGGIDGSRLATPLYVSKSDGSSALVQYGTDVFSTFRARNVKGKQLRLERSVHYGNVGNAFTDVLPVDDPYKFAPENMRELWYRARDITDRYGYDLRFNSQGNVVLSPRANPSYAYDITTSNTNSTGTVKTHPSAFGGTYIEFAGTESPVVTVDVTGARIDLVFPRGPSLGTWNDIRVVRLSDNKEVARVQQLDPSIAGSDFWFYDYRDNPTGDNATLYTVFSGDYDTYRVTMTALIPGQPADGKVRRVDTAFVYHTDPLQTKYSSTFSTAVNALSVSTSGAADDHRNLVYVVGDRKTTATDSEKLKTNPNNPNPEFVVSVAADVDSIVNPEASNYIGLKRETLIVDPNIVDQDYADYLSRTLIYRYRVARPQVAINHTLMPVVETRDPILAEEATFDTVSPKRTVWVTGFTHVFDKGGYRTELRTSAFPEFPSYEVRSDIDIDATFSGLPITNVEVSYTALTGQTETNVPATGVVHESTDADVVVINDLQTPAQVHAAAGGNPEYLDLTGQPWPPIPGTVFLTPPGGAQGTTQITTTMPSPLPPNPTTPGGVITATPGNPIAFVPLRSVAQLISVTVTCWRALSPSVVVQDQAFNLAPSSKLDNTMPFYYQLETSGKPQVVVMYKPEPVLKQNRLFNTYPTMFTVSVVYDQGEAGAVTTTVTNNPYHHLMNIDYRDSNKKIYLPWKHGDGTSAYARNTGITSYDIKYRAFGPVDGSGNFLDPYASRGGSPFYDPYTSELGELVRFKFDALVSGSYRITVRSVKDPDIVVAYLTEPTADASVPESHWTYLTAGADKEFFWDGIDQVGEWNLLQSEEVSGLVRGAFDSADAQPIGAGWYAWNRERNHGDYGALAVISGDRDADGKPVFGQGTYSEWFFAVECKNDDLAAIADANPADASKQLPRMAATSEPTPGKVAPIYTTSTTSAVVYMHLPDPTAAELLIDDWVAAFSYDPLNASHVTTAANWGLVDADATINNTKPVRIRFNVLPRPGVLWSTQQSEAEVKLTRHVHPRAVIFDQFLVSEGTQYSNGNKALTAVEERTLYTRRLQNDSHTIEFQDSGYRKAKSFFNPTYPNGSAVWVFTPNTVKKNFRGIDNEPLQFMDYLQLEELPNWDPNKAAGSPRSRFILAFMAYLFYLSAYTQDRSGRRVWCMNRSFLDKSKISSNAYGDWWVAGSPGTAATSTTYQNTYPVDMTRQFRRTIVCRQWTNEGTWIADQTTKWNLNAGTGVGAALLKHKWDDHEAASTTLNGVAWPALVRDDYSHYHTDGRSQLPNTFNGMLRQLGGISGAATTTQLGNWTWEYLNSVAWIPCVTRDWHPYFMVPPMCDTPDAHTYHTQYIYGIVDGTDYNFTDNIGEDVAKQLTWQSWVRDAFEPYAQNGNKKFTVGSSVDPNAAPNNPPPANVLNYVRQDELTHFESIRGIYSRGPRPAEGPKKLTPDMPYYLNPMRYSKIVPNKARNQAKLPDFKATLTKWFRMAFRHEYLWESNTLFPVDAWNREFLEAFNAPRTRFGRQLSGEVFYDAGAYIGWKDDSQDGQIHGYDTNDSSSNVFASEWMPVAVGPELPETRNLFFHMLLLNERRDVPL